MRYFKISVVAVMLLIVWSCSDDDNNGPSVQIIPPTVQIVETDTSISRVDTIARGSRFNVVFSAVRGDNPMNTWSLKSGNQVYDSRTGLVPDIDNFTLEIEDILAPLDTGLFRFEIEVKDNAGYSRRSIFEVYIFSLTSLEEPIVSIGANGSVTGSTELLVRSEFSIEIIAIQGTTEMESWSILRDSVKLAGFDDMPVPDPNSFSTIIVDIPVPANTGTYTYSFEVVDKSSAIGISNWVITATEPTSFTEFTNMQLGAQSSTSGSFYKVSDGTILSLAGANSSDGIDVDFFYFVGAINGSTLWSPTNVDASGLFSGAIGNWTTRNDTRISSSSLDYNSVTPLDISSASVSGTKANQLSQGDVVIFETSTGIKGILRVSSLVPGNDGSLTFDAKVIF